MDHIAFGRFLLDPVICVSRFSIAGFMMVVLYLAMCLAALRLDDPRLGSATVYSVTAGFVASCAFLAFARQDRYQMLRVGFAHFAWVYMVLGFGSFFGEREPIGRRR